jgi:hypothetical protein
LGSVNAAFEYVTQKGYSVHVTEIPTPGMASPASGNVFSRPEQAGGLLLPRTASSIAPKSNPQTTTPPYPQLTSQMHESMYPQLDPPAPLDASARQREVALDSASASTPASHTQSASAPGAEGESTTSDIVAALNAFSRLPPDQRHALLPVFGTIAATQQPSGALTGVSPLPGAPPPSYAG